MKRLGLILWLGAPTRLLAQGAGRLTLPSGASSDLSWTVVVILTLVTLLPAILISMTPFVRLLVVFHFLRQALGTQTAPSNQVLIGLSLFLTYFIMQPVGALMYQQAVVPYNQGHMDITQALTTASGPLENFMLHFTREQDLALFVEAAHVPRPRTAADLPMRVVIPAYIVSELQTGFQIGVVLFLPFLAIDLVVASITTSVGMMQLPPVVISTPLKLLVFVAAGGWHLLVGSLLHSFA
ncbi:MAG TPA: flagellar type III secretion system pore protein FliP [Terriglobales bacterium]|jgi:flagellar biosynthetic protein FliP